MPARRLTLAARRFVAIQCAGAGLWRRERTDGRSFFMASVMYRCPHCAGTFQVEPRATDQQVHCTHCRGLVTIAAAAAAPPTPKPVVVAAATAPPKGPQVAPLAVKPSKPSRRTATVIELEPESPLVAERPTAEVSLAPLTTPLDELSIHEVLNYGRAHKVSDIHVAPGRRFVSAWRGG